MPKALNILIQALLFSLLPTSEALLAADMDTAYAAREKAITAKAQTLAPESWQSAEKELEKAIRFASDGKNPAKVAAAYDDAVAEFSKAELEAIEIDLLTEARQALESADDQRAKRYAPETRNYSMRQLQAAEAALAADPYNRETISALAADAAAHARYATRIAAVVKADPEIETLIRERDAYIQRLGVAAGSVSAVDADPNKVVDELEDYIANLYLDQLQLKQDLSDAQAFVAALEEEIRDLDNELGGASDERRQLVLQLEEQARTEEKFLQTELLFQPSEAEVLRQSDNVVLRLFGLDFAPGSSKLDDSHSALLGKISQAIAIFPGSILAVEGHTDSQGSSRMNQRLSQNRADAVMNYIVMNMQVAPSRISAVGFGPEKPIANNDTEEGRAKNRRIDLIIKP